MSMPGTSVKVHGGYLESYASQMVLLHSKLNWKLENGRTWRRHQDHLIQRASDPPASDPPSPTQSEVSESIPSELEKTRPYI